VLPIQKIWNTSIPLILDQISMYGNGFKIILLKGISNLNKIKWGKEKIGDVLPKIISIN
jgi:hypothetical protein